MAASDELRALRLERNIPARDLAAAIQRHYPKFDKTVLSKCEHWGEYGVQIRPDVLDDLYAEFAPDLLERRKRARAGGNRLTCRISARLEDDDYEALQRRMEADGFKTNQEWVTAMVRQYINGGRCP